MAGKVSDVLDMVPLFDNSIDPQSGGKDETRAILALNVAQHYFETLCATYARVLQDTIDITTTINTETTPWETSLLRLDAMWLLDPDTGRPIRRLNRIEEVGGQVPSLPWPLQLTMGQGTGTPGGYYANQNNFYWLPLPDGTSTLRIYGFLEASEYTIRTANFAYPLRCKSAFAAFVAKILKAGVDDEGAINDTLAQTIFRPLMKSLKNFDRSQPHGRYYGEVHVT